MRRILIVVLATCLILIANALFWIAHCTTHIYADGRFQLTVNVICPNGVPQSVTCEAFGQKDAAEYTLSHLLPPEIERWAATADSFDGTPLIVDVPCGSRESMTGRVLSRSQFRYLVVIATMPDGRPIGKLVEIPDRRESRQVSVVLQ